TIPPRVFYFKILSHHVLVTLLTTTLLISLFEHDSTIASAKVSSTAEKIQGLLHGERTILRRVKKGEESAESGFGEDVFTEDGRPRGGGMSRLQTRRFSEK
ncbi:unnamed protein product, partial [Heterotrigona itama]